MSKEMRDATHGWLDKLIGKEVVVAIRSEEDRYLGILRHVDLDPVKAGLGPTVVLQNSAGRHAVVFDVSVVGDEDFLPEDDDDDVFPDDDTGNDLTSSPA